MENFQIFQAVVTAIIAVILLKNRGHLVRFVSGSVLAVEAVVLAMPQLTNTKSIVVYITIMLIVGVNFTYSYVYSLNNLLANRLISIFLFAEGIYFLIKLF